MPLVDERVALSLLYAGKTWDKEKNTLSDMFDGEDADIDVDLLFVDADCSEVKNQIIEAPCTEVSMCPFMFASSAFTSSSGHAVIPRLVQHLFPFLH